MKKAISIIIFIALACYLVPAKCQSSGNNIDNNIAEITGQIEESMLAAAEIEERIRSRNFFTRIFLGGDWQAGRELEEVVNQNNERIEELKQIMEQCGNCSDEEMENAETVIREHKRFKAVAVIEQKTRGLFGWFKR